MIQLCNALSALHRAPQCVIHSDIKPANIMIHPKGHLTLIDLGISKPSGATRDTSPYGTIAYMAPEQLSLEAITPRTDIYSFGVVLFENADRTTIVYGKSSRNPSTKTPESSSRTAMYTAGYSTTASPVFAATKQCFVSSSTQAPSEYRNHKNLALWPDASTICTARDPTVAVCPNARHRLSALCTPQNTLETRH